jgi:hypothetical protein
VNELAFVPEIVMPLIVSVPFPVFLRVDVCAVADWPSSVLTKVSVLGERLVAGAVMLTVAVPVPAA